MKSTKEILCFFIKGYENVPLRNRMVSYILVTDNQKLMMRRDVFQAIADPTRREIINLLSINTLTINEVAEKFNISRPAVSKHIKILQECGLVKIIQEGRERYCSVDHSRLIEVSDWIKKYEVFWSKKLDALEKFLLKEKKQ